MDKYRESEKTYREDVQRKVRADLRKFRGWQKSCRAKEEADVKRAFDDDVAYAGAKERTHVERAQKVAEDTEAAIESLQDLRYKISRGAERHKKVVTETVFEKKASTKQKEHLARAREKAKETIARRRKLDIEANLNFL